MKTSSKLYVIAAAIVGFVAMSLTSCKKATFIKTDKDTIATTISGTENEINISTDGPEVEVEHAPNWMKISMNEDHTKLHYTIPLNTDQKLREDSLVLTSRGMSKTIPVRQTFKATYIKLSSNVLNFSRAGGRQEVNVDVDSESGITTDYPQIARVEGRKIYVTLNSGIMKASKQKVKVMCDDLSTTLLISQESNKCPTCGGKGILNKPHADCNGEGCHGCQWTCKEPCPTCYGEGLGIDKEYQ